jgi:hypothetical protein
MLKAVAKATPSTVSSLDSSWNCGASKRSFSILSRREADLTFENPCEVAWAHGRSLRESLDEQSSRRWSGSHIKRSLIGFSGIA